MKPKALTALVMSLSLAACAAQSIHSPQRHVDEKVYAAYTQLIGKQSYAFEGELRLNVQPLSIQPKAVNPIVQAELNKLAQQRQLTPSERQWLDQGLTTSAEDEHAKAKASGYATLYNRVYMQIDGVVDPAHGQFSLNPKLGYRAKNMQTWSSFPLALDLRQAKFYADLSAWSPVVTNPHYDGRYMLFDYAQFAERLKDQQIDVKALLGLVKQYMLLNPALSTAADYQVLPLTASDQAKGGVQRIAYQSNYQTLLQQYLLFVYLNEPYLDQSIGSSQQHKTAAVKPQPDGFAAEQSDRSNAAQQAGQRFKAALEDLKQAAQSADAGADRSSTASGVDTAHSEQATAKATSIYTTVDADEYQSSMAEILAEQHAADSAVSVRTRLISELFLADVGDPQLLDQFWTALRAFDHYRSTELIGALQIKQIVSEQAEAYAKFGEIVGRIIKKGSGTAAPDFKITMEMLLDRKDRLIAAEGTLYLPSMPKRSIEELKAQFVFNIHDYGKARVDPKALQQAVAYHQVLDRLSPIERLNKLVLKEMGDLNSSQNWSSTQRLDKLADALLAKKMTRVEVYQTLLWYAVLQDQYQHQDQGFSLQQSQALQQAVLFESLQYAHQHGLALSAKQQRQWQSLNNPAHANLGVSADTVSNVEQVLSKALQRADLRHDIDLWQQQGKTTAQIFASVYQQLDRQLNRKAATEPYDQGRLATFEVLGEVAAQDLKQQKIDRQILQKLNVLQLSQIDASIYQQAYQLLLEHR